MKLSPLLAVAFRTLVPLLLCAVSQADVIYVDAAGNGQHTAIQPAIAAALDGDVLLVRTGTYTGFTLDNRRLSVIADAGALVKVAGTVAVRNTSASGVVLIAGIQIVPPDSDLQIKGLDLASNAGHVRFQKCTVIGSEGSMGGGPPGEGGMGASIVNSSKVVFVACNVTGGNGGGLPLFVDYGGKGGHGVVTQGSSVAFYDCTLKGGVGGAADYITSFQRAGDGGDGCRVLDFGILASGCQFQGGMGGGYATIPGNGGIGLFVDAGQAQLISNTYAGGMGGMGYYGGFGANGPSQSGPGVFHTFPGAARKIAGPSLAAESATMQIDVTGAPGDRVWLLRTAQPEFVYLPSYAGMRLISLLSSFTVKPDVVLSPSGTASVQVRTHRIGAGIPQVTQYWQCLVENTAGQLRLGSPLHVAVLNCSDLPPDCNGNASCDSCDLLQGISLDCDKNGVPDECSGDCNANGIADSCDIFGGTSIDQNHNGVPDECEPQTTWHVDVNAGPGGNGTLGAPFQTLGAAFSAAISADTIRVANGLYQGIGNRELDFGGRNLIVLGNGGAANCVIDCQQLGRAFSAGTGVTSASLIQGLTIRNGKASQFNNIGGGIYLQGSSPTILQCVFDHCQAGSGGGLFASNSSAVIRGSTFIACTSSIRGGGMKVESSSNVRLVDCNFVSCQSGEGGGFSTLGPTTRIERCFFQSNSASGAGGAFHGFGGQVFLDQCWIAGNSAAYGGGIFGLSSLWSVTNSTIVDNHGSNRAGAAYLANQNGMQSWRNNILWNNTAPVGSQFYLVSGPLDIAWCDVQGAQASILIGGPQANLTWGPGNLDLDPLFVDRDGPDNNALTIGDNDYRLALTSPCLDAGDNASVAADWFDLDGDGNVTEAVPLDFDGNSRFVDIPSAPDTGNGVSPLVDLGAWERP